MEDVAHQQVAPLTYEEGTLYYVHDLMTQDEVVVQSRSNPQTVFLHKEEITPERPIVYFRGVEMDFLIEVHLYGYESLTLPRTIEKSITLETVFVFGSLNSDHATLQAECLKIIFSYNVHSLLIGSHPGSAGYEKKLFAVLKECQDVKKPDGLRPTFICTSLHLLFHEHPAEDVFQDLRALRVLRKVCFDFKHNLQNSLIASFETTLTYNKGKPTMSKNGIQLTRMSWLVFDTLPIYVVFYLHDFPSDNYSLLRLYRQYRIQCNALRRKTWFNRSVDLEPFDEMFPRFSIDGDDVQNGDRSLRLAEMTRGILRSFDVLCFNRNTVYRTEIRNTLRERLLLGNMTAKMTDRIHSLVFVDDQVIAFMLGWVSKRRNGQRQTSHVRLLCQDILHKVFFEFLVM
jgi:hypothetical protein